MDALIHVKHRRVKDGVRPYDCLACYLVTKFSWRGKYRRVFCITNSTLVTNLPESFFISNQYLLQGSDAEINKVAVGKSEDELIISARGKNERKFVELRFSCSQRAALLSDLYQVLAVQQPQIINISNTATIFNAVKLKRRSQVQWEPCRLRVGLTAIERFDGDGQKIKWVLEYKNMNSPGVMLLTSGENDPPQVFALFGKIGRSPRVYAMPGRDAFLSQLQSAASSRFGVNVNVENNKTSGLSLLNSVVSAQQEQSAMANEAPLSSWTVRRIICGKVRDRRLVICQAAILERRVSSEEVCERRPLKALELIVRYCENGRRFQLQWSDGYEGAVYEALNRDEVVCAIMDAVQIADGRSVALLMGETERADKLLGSNEKELQSVCGNLLVAALKEYALSRTYSPGQTSSPRVSVAREFDNGEKYDNNSVGSDNSGGNSGVGVGVGVLTKNIAATVQTIKNQAQSQVPQLAEQEAQDILFLRLKVINANIPYSKGLEVSGAQQRQLVEHSWVLGYLIGQELENDCLLQVLQCAGRLGYIPNFVMQGLFQQPKTPARLLELLRCSDDGIQCETARLLIRLLAPAQFKAGVGSWTEVEGGVPAEVIESISKIKSMLFGSGIDQLWGGNDGSQKDSLVLSMFMVELLCTLIVAPCSKSTPLDVLKSTQKATAGRPKTLFSIFQHPASRARDGAAMLARAVITGAGPVSQSLRASALQEAAVLRHLRLAMFSQDDTGQQALSRELIEMWCDKSYAPAQQLIKQILPFGLLQTLHQGGWQAFWKAFEGQHRHAGLIWNNQTRSELRQQLDQQDEAFRGAQSSGQNESVRWNWQEFLVQYPSLKPEPFVGGVYVALLLEGGDAAIAQLGEPRELFSQCFYKFLCSDDIEVKVLCKKVMAKVYRMHPVAVGPFWGLDQCLYILDNTTSIALREAEVELLSSMLEGEIGKEAKLQNGRKIIEGDGVQLFLELTLTSHWRVSRGPTQGSQVKLITAYTHEQQQQKEWYYMGGESQEEIKGPISKEEIKSLYTKGIINMKTQVKNKQESAFTQLKDVRQLRWWLSGVGKVSVQCLRLLHSLVEMFAPDSSEMVYPPPRVYSQLCSEKNLHHISQIMLSNQPELVGATALLLTRLSTVIPEALHRLYSTGAFFFALLYTGSDWAEIAKLFKISHLEQHSSDNNDEHRTGLLSRRSYLGALLPESLLYQLERYGSDVFASKFVQECDDPELLWTNEMRFDCLVHQLSNHIGEFPLRLQDNILLFYEYTPPPPIGYPQLDEEIWCHGYYLRSLCQTEKFPDYPIKEPVPFLQSLLMEWRRELTKQPLSMSEIEARKLLGLPDSADDEQQTKEAYDEELRKAYRRMARIYHPDKNPEGKKQFMEIQKAYELLQHTSRGGSAGGGTELWRIRLVLSAQCIVFRRCKKELEPFKYAGYPMLLEALTVPESSALFGLQTKEEIMSSKVLLAAAELCWLTCACSPRNGEELTRCGGVPIVGKLLRRCVSMVPSSEAATATAMYLIGSLAALSMFQVGREQLAQESAVGVVQDVLWACTLGDRASGCSSAGLTCISQMCTDDRLQELLISSKAVQKVLPLLFQYDSTQVNFNPILENTELIAQQGVIATGLDASAQESVQMNKNFRAQLGVVCLCRLAGLLGGELESPSNQQANSYLEGALTRPLMSRLLQLDAHKELLNVLNEGIETPESVWSLSMRLQLLKFLEEDEEADLTQLSFKDVCNEVVITNVYVRLYTEQQEWVLSQPAQFCKDLIIYLHKEIATPQQQGPEDLALVFQTEQTDSVVLQRKHLFYVLKALMQVLQQHPNKISLLATWSAITPFLMCARPTILAGNYQILKKSFMQLLYQELEEKEVQEQKLSESKQLLNSDVKMEVENLQQFKSQICQLSLKTMVKLLESAKCVTMLGRDEVYYLCVWLAHRSWKCIEVQQALTLLHGVANNRDATWFASEKGGCVFLLNILLPIRDRKKETKIVKQHVMPVRQSVGKTLSIMLKDQLHGERLKLVLLRLLPEGLVELIVRSQIDRLVQVLDVEKELETPEIIWNNRMYDFSASEIEDLVSKARSKQAEQTKSGQPPLWNLPEKYSIQHEILQHQLYIGGVYVQLFLKSPEFPLQDPPRFLQCLLQELEKRLPEKDSSEKSSDIILSLCAASAQLLRYQRSLAAVCVRLGVVDFVVKHLSSRVETGQDDVSGGLLRLLHQLMYYKDLAEVIPNSKYKPVKLLQQVIAWGLAPAIIALETLKRALEHRIDKVHNYTVEQALNTGLLDELLLILQQGSSGIAQQSEENARRVLSIDVINLLSEGESQWSEQVQTLLNESEIWQSYKGRKHDLFLPHGTQESGGVIAALGGGTLTTYALPSPQTQQESRQ